MRTRPSCRHHPERTTLTKLTFGKRLAVVLIQHIEWFVWRQLTNATTLSAARRPDVP